MKLTLKNKIMNKKELKQENEELLLHIYALDIKVKQLEQKLNVLKLKKYAIRNSNGSFERYDYIFNLLNPNVNVNHEPATNDSQQFQLWDEVLGMISWKFTPRESGDMELDLNSVYENDLKGKYKLVKL